MGDWQQTDILKYCSSALSPALQYLVKQILFSGIAGFKSDSLKPTETKEKVVLPGEDDIKTEKTIQGVLQVRIGTVKAGRGIKKSCCRELLVLKMRNLRMSKLGNQRHLLLSCRFVFLFFADLKVENIRTFSDWTCTRLQHFCSEWVWPDNAEKSRNSWEELSTLNWSNCSRNGAHKIQGNFVLKHQ